MTRCSGSFPATLGLTRNSFQVRMLFKKLTAPYISTYYKEHRKCFECKEFSSEFDKGQLCIGKLSIAKQQLFTCQLTWRRCPNPANPYNTVVGILPEKWLRKSCCCNHTGKTQRASNSRTKECKRERHLVGIYAAIAVGSRGNNNVWQGMIIR